MKIIDKFIRLEKDAAEYGFKWSYTEQIIQQIRSEICEVENHLHDQNTDKLKEEIGDLLHAALSLTVFLKLDPLNTITASVAKFERRLNEVKKQASAEGLISLNNQPFDKLMQLWDNAKKSVG